LTFRVRRRVVERPAIAEGRLADADDFDRVRAGEAGVAVVDGDTVGFEQLPDTIGQPLDDGVFALENGGIVEANVVGEDAEIGAVLQGLEHFGAAQHGLGRDAPPVEAHAPGALLLNQRDA